MRKLLARWMAVVTGLLVCVLAVLFAMIQNPGHKPAAVILSEKGILPKQDKERSARLTSDRIDIELGRTIYEVLKCGTCHSIAGQGNRSNPLDGAGNRLTTSEIHDWIVTPGEIDPDIRKPDYSHLSPDHLKLLVNYISSLK